MFRVYGLLNMFHVINFTKQIPTGCHRPKLKKKFVKLTAVRDLSDRFRIFRSIRSGLSTVQGISRDSPVYIRFVPRPGLISVGTQYVPYSRIS